MQFEKSFTLPGGQELLVRNGVFEDGQTVLDVFNAAHAETDFLLTYPDENSFTPESEAEFLREKTDSPREIELIAFVDGVPVGTAGFEAIGRKSKVLHRCDFGISILQQYWGLGIGRRLMEVCIDLAREAGYRQMELEVVADNTRAVSLYRHLGFVEYGRNPLGFVSRYTGDQELILMRLVL